MIHRDLKIGRWIIDFLFAEDSFDDELVLQYLYDADASFAILKRVSEMMEENRDNTGFTYTNPSLMQAVVVVGPVSSGKEFIDTLVHEVHHLAVAIASNLGIDIEGETPAYLAGDSVRELADIICKLGCASSNFDNETF